MSTDRREGYTRAGSVEVRPTTRTAGRSIEHRVGPEQWSRLSAAKNAGDGAAAEGFDDLGNGSVALEAEKHAALARLSQMAGNRKTISIGLLGDLGIRVGRRGLLGTGSFSFTGGAVTLAPTDALVGRQGRVKVERVRWYIEQCAAGSEMERMAITDRPGDGAWWHIDGVHRVLASRLLGRKIEAEVWR